MTPRRSRRLISGENAIIEEVTAQEDGSKANRNTAQSFTLVVPKLAAIPPELFDEIMQYFPTLPLIWYYDTSPGGIPDLKYAERTAVLRVLSGTCKALRQVALPRLWSRIDAVWVPERARGVWYKYVMEELRRKTDGVWSLDTEVRGYIRTASLMLSKSDIKNTAQCVPKLLKALPSLHTVQILNLKVTGDFKSAVSGLSLPSVHTLVIPSEANALIRACPNVKHVRCAGGDGSALIAALKGSQCEILDGMIDWCKDPKLVKRLVKNIPTLNTLEIRRPVTWGLGLWTYTFDAPMWTTVIPALSGLRELRSLTITFGHADELPDDLQTAAAARAVMRDSQLAAKRTLVIRRVEAPHYTHTASRQHDLDLVLRSSVEMFEK